MLTESREAISFEAVRFRKSPQIPAFASLSSPQFDANPFSAASDNVPDFSAFPASPACGGDGAGTAIMGICGTFESSLFDDLP
jgi:hypothetical protein